MEDWAQFFQEKSRRRFDKDRRDRRRRAVWIVVAGALIGVAIMAAIMGVNLFD